MSIVEPKVTIIARTQPEDVGIRQWLNDLGANEFQIPEGTAAGTALTTLAGKRCYLSFEVGLNPNITKVREDLTAFIDNIMASGHGSTLEHTNYTFAVENVSRIFTAEFNRHRAGVAVSEGSLRYIRFDEDIPYWIPESIQPTSWADYMRQEHDVTSGHDMLGFTADEGTQKEILEKNPVDRELVEYWNIWTDTENKKAITRRIFARAFAQMEQNYKALLEIWDYETLTTFKEKKHLTSLFRRIIGMGVATGGVWTGNLRALRHIFTMRCDPAAEEEICLVASLMLEKMIEAEPEIFSDFEKVDGYWQPKYRKV